MELQLKNRPKNISGPVSFIKNAFQYFKPNVLGSSCDVKDVIEKGKVIRFVIQIMAVEIGI